MKVAEFESLSVVFSSERVTNTHCGSDSRCILNRRVLLLLDLDAEEELADFGFLKFDGRASKESGELAAAAEVVACGGGADIAEHEVLGHAAVKLSPEELLVKEKTAHQEVEHATAGQHAG
jgi:hypothetical protein